MAKIGCESYGDDTIWARGARGEGRRIRELTGAVAKIGVELFGSKPCHPEAEDYAGAARTGCPISRCT